MEINISGEVYTVATSLRVPYEMQKDFGNKPYTSIFEGLQSSTLEDQIRIIHTAFRIKNPSKYTFEQFMELVLDEWTLQKVLDTIGDIMEAVTGASKDKKEKKLRIV